MLREQLLDVPGELAGLVDFRRPWLDPLQADVVDHLADLPLLIVQRKVHQTRSSSRAMTTRCTWLVPS